MYYLMSNIYPAQNIFVSLLQKEKHALAIMQ